MCTGDESFLRSCRCCLFCQVREKHTGKEQPNVPLNLALVYEAGTEVHSQEILQVQSDTQLLTNEAGRANLKVPLRWTKIVYVCAFSPPPSCCCVHSHKSCLGQGRSCHVLRLFLNFLPFSCTRSLRCVRRTWVLVVFSWAVRFLMCSPTIFPATNTTTNPEV